MPQKTGDKDQFEAEKMAYNILLQRHLNDDRLLGERSTIFLASSSILFLGFVTLPQAAVAFRIFIAALGIVLCFFVLCSNWRTKKGLDFWKYAEEKLEKETDSFDYMRRKAILPQLVYKEIERDRMGWLFGRMRNRLIFTYYLPLTFSLLWIGSIVWILI
jgi:hypothetical protein